MLRAASIRPPNTPQLRRRKLSHLVEDGLDVDGQISVRAAEPSHDAEPQARRASLQSDGFVLPSAVGREVRNNVILG